MTQIYGDQKRKKSRSRGWTQVDQRASDASYRRQERERSVQRQARENMLNAMASEEREKFLAHEKAEEMRLAKEAEKRQEEYARQLKLERENLVADSRLMAGYLQSEIATAVSYKESHGQPDGDWLDDPVAALTGQGGFGEEVAKSVGIKLQIHLCLDCSNSMYYNNLTQVSTAVMRTLYLALTSAAEQLPDDSLKTHMWLWAQGESGKTVSHITNPDNWNQPAEDDSRSYTVFLPGQYSGSWTGEDTWIHPLLDALDRWEQREGDPGAYRLDIIISDGMLEHPTDARKGDVIQDRRDGNLQSIMLNFLPMADWADYRVPNRCVQYPATSENLLGLLNAILGEWLVSL